MKGEDIDKLFREKLSGSVEPTTEQDWNTFEAGLETKKGFITSKTITIALLFLIGAGVATYYLGGFDSENPGSDGKVELSSSKDQISSKNRSKKIESPNKITESNQNLDIKSQNPKPQNLSEISRAESLASEQSLQNSQQPNTIQTDQEKNNARRFETTLSEREGAFENMKQSENEKEEQSKSENSLASTTGQLNSNRTEDDPYKKVDVKDLNYTSDKKKPVEPLVFDTQSFNSLGGIHSAKTLASNTSTKQELYENIDNRLTQLTPLSGVIHREVGPNTLVESKRVAKILRSQKFETFVYLKAEHNLLLQNGFAGGVGLSMPFGNQSNWTRNISLSAGIGFQRTGTLAWRQSRQEVSYGFDKYTRESELLTERLDLIQVPVYLNYSFAGLHQVFFGLESSFVIGTAQTLSTNSPFDDRQINESGNLFDTNSPDYIYFLHLGYGYSISERYQLQIGGSYSNQVWQTNENTPLGLFLKLNYQIR